MKSRDKRQKLLKEVLEAQAVEFPNSIVADLLTHFSTDTVIRFIEIYSGQTITMPKVESIWRSYRNKVIREALDLKNTRAVRDRLAIFFKISLRQVSNIYCTEKRKRTKVRISTARWAARRVFNDELHDAFKDMNTTFSRRK